MRRRTIAGLLAGLTIFGVVFAMAASLGAITSDTVGASDAAVASCDTDGVSTDYTSSWDATNEQYEVTSVAVTGIANECDGDTLSVSLTNSGGAQIGSGSVTIPTNALGTSATVSLSAGASAEATVGIHVAIA